jgi:prophage DNA circulation protein
MSDAINDIVGALKNPYGTPSTGEWNLNRAVYVNKKRPDGIVLFYETKKDEPRGVVTAMDQANDTGSRKLAIYKYPYRDGQRISDLGRDGETYTFNLKFVGQNYQQKFQDFLDVVVNSNEIGRFTHPIRGVLNVRLKDWDFIHRHDEFNAVTIKAIFLEDNTDSLQAQFNDIAKATADSAIRNAMQTLLSNYRSIQTAIFEIGAQLLVGPNILAGIEQRLNTILGQSSSLLGGLAASFSTDAALQLLASQAAASNAGSIAALNSGTVVSGGTVSKVETLPPVFQVGYDEETQASINAQADSFISQNQITPQQAVFTANQTRQQISAAIKELEDTFGNDAYDMVLQYQAIAISMQTSVEASIAQVTTEVKKYVLPYSMSLRSICFLNSLDPDRQNELEKLNPYLPSINWIPAGYTVTVPAA